MARRRKPKRTKELSIEDKLFYYKMEVLFCGMWDTCDLYSIKEADPFLDNMKKDLVSQLHKIVIYCEKKHGMWKDVT